jgi:hypothetical protein
MALELQLSPTDLTFLYNDSPRDFYLKVRHKVYRPREPMASIFNKIDKYIKKSFADLEDIKTMSDELPSGKILISDKKVRSAPMVFDVNGQEVHISINGIFDSILQEHPLEENLFDVIDYKTSSVKDDYIEIYSRQLHAYAYCLENPFNDIPVVKLDKINRLGLIVYEPNGFELENVSLTGTIQWVEMEYNREDFREFMREVAEVLAGDLPTTPTRCDYTKYAQNLLDHGLLNVPTG